MYSIVGHFIFLEYNYIDCIYIYCKTLLNQFLLYEISLLLILFENSHRQNLLLIRYGDLIMIETFESVIFINIYRIPTTENRLLV